MATQWKAYAKTAFTTCMGAALLLVLAIAPAGAQQLQPVNLQATDQIDAVAIVLTRFGPYPASFTHPATPFLLSIVNRSGVLEDTISIIYNPSGAANPPSSPASVTSLLDLHSTSLRQRDHQIIKPLPGNYQLTFKAHPDWVVNVTITAQ